MQTIYLDISNKGVIPTIYAKQGDVGRKFEVVLTDSGLPYVPANGSAFSVWYLGASGDGNYTEIGDKSAFSVNGNKVTVEMIAQMLSNDGDGVLSLVLNDPNANQISTWNIPYICESVPGADSEEAKDYYTAFSKAVENLPYPDTSLSVAGKAADAAAVGAALSGKAPALDWSHLKWYVMGDSLTAQDNAFTNKRYYDFVQEKTGIQIIVDGIGGTGYGAGASNSESYYDRVQNIPDDVDIVTIFGSGNDIRYAESANMEIYNTLSWMALNKPGLRVIVVPPSPWKDYNKREDPWKAYCDRLQACASVCNFRYVSDMYDCPPFNPNFTGHMELFFTTDPEGIHPDENGHKALAPYFYNALLEELALDESVVVSPGGSGGSGGSGSAVDIPTALPNPHKLTFTGAVQAEYDGSEPVKVKIPESGGIEVTGASVGQTIVVKAVDDNGKPTEWETRDFPDSGGNAVQGGLSTTATTLLIAILRNAVYSTDQSANIDALKTDLESSAGGGDSGGSEAPNYTVTNALTNITTSNEATSVASGSSYSATLTALDGFTIEEVAILMGNVDITSTAYNGGIITIESVTGNIVITANAVSVNVKTLNDYDYSELADYYTCTFGGEGVSPGIRVQNPNNQWGAMSVDDEYLAELLSNETITIVAAHDDYGFGPGCKATKTGGGGNMNISPVSSQQSVYDDDSGNHYSYATWDISDIKTVITENNICVLEFGMGQAHRYHGVFGMILHNVPNGVVTQEMLLNTIKGA